MGKKGFNSGVLSDAFGRKRLVLGTMLVHMVATWSAYLAPNYWAFLVARSKADILYYNTHVKRTKQ